MLTRVNDNHSLGKNTDVAICADRFAPRQRITGANGPSSQAPFAVPALSSYLGTENSAQATYVASKHDALRPLFAGRMWRAATPLDATSTV